MSVVHWICKGIGVRSSEVYPFLNQKKCLAELKKLLPDDEDVQNINIEFDDFDINDFMHGEPYMYLGHFLSQLDTSMLLSYGEADNESFCYYSPRYPWDISENDPKSLSEARALVKNVIRKVCDIDNERLEKLIDDDIYEYGCG